MLVLLSAGASRQAHSNILSKTRGQVSLKSVDWVEAPSISERFSPVHVLCDLAALLRGGKFTFLVFQYCG